MSYVMADRALLEVLQSVGHTFVMDFNRSISRLAFSTVGFHVVRWSFVSSVIPAKELF
jgi:hypothetical protein